MEVGADHVVALLGQGQHPELDREQLLENTDATNVISVMKRSVVWQVRAEGGSCRPCRLGRQCSLRFRLRYSGSTALGILYADK